MELEVITWQHLLEACKDLAHQLPHGSTIWGIKRGGAIVAGIMSFYGCNLSQRLDPGMIVVDDIADTGDTLLVYDKEGFYTAALYKRVTCESLPDYTAKIVTSKNYILFPWESREEAEKRKGFRNGNGNGNGLRG